MLRRIFISTMVVLLFASIAYGDNPLMSRWLGGSLILYPMDSPGNQWCVNSSASNASDNSTGKDWEHPLATWDAAVNKCTEDNGDIIWLHPKHAEDIALAGGVAFDIAGVETRGLGYGDNWPTISLTTGYASIAIRDADTKISGVKFLGNYSGGVVECIDVCDAGDGSVIEGCWFAETSDSKELLIMITLTTNADKITIRNNRFIGYTGSGTDVSAIVAEGGTDETIIEGNKFYGDWSSYVIDAETTASIDLMIKDNVINNLDTSAGKTIKVHANTTGDIVGNYAYGNGSSFIIVGAKMNIANNYNTQLEAVIDPIGVFTGDGGTGQDDNIKASLDLLHTAVDTAIASSDDWDNGGRLDLIQDQALSDGNDILADTGELQTDLTNGGRLDLLFDQMLLDGNNVNTDTDSIIASLGVADWANGGRLDTLLDQVLADGNTVIASTDDWDEDGRLDVLLDVIQADGNDWNNGGRLDLIQDQMLSDGNDILADTGELQTDWTNNGRLDDIIDQVLADGNTIIADTDEMQQDLENTGRLDELFDQMLLDGNSVNADTDLILADTAAIDPGAVRLATFTKTNWDGAIGDNKIFTISGGPVRVIELFGLVTVQLDGACNVLFKGVATAPGGDVEISTATPLNNPDPAGTIIGTNATFGAATVVDAAGTVGVGCSFIQPNGDIEINLSANIGTDDEIVFYIRYEPMVAGAAVAAYSP